LGLRGGGGREGREEGVARGEKGVHSCEAGEGLLEVGEDGAEGDAVEALELAAGGDENVLQAPVRRDPIIDSRGRGASIDGL